MSIYYAKTWGKSITGGGERRGAIILGQPETDYRGWSAPRESRAAELSPALTWLQGRHRWPGLFVCRLHFFSPEQIPNPSFQRNEKTDLLGQRLSLRSVLVAVCQHRASTGFPPWPSPAVGRLEPSSNPSLRQGLEVIPWEAFNRVMCPAALPQYFSPPSFGMHPGDV